MKLKHFKKENGQAMVEFALVLPILLLFIAGILDFGWIYHNQLSANNASREAARHIAVHYYSEGMDSATATTKAFNMIKDYTNITDIVVDTIIPEDDGGSGGEKIRVRFAGKVIILTPIARAIIDKDGDGKFPIRAETHMRVEK